MGDSIVIAFNVYVCMCMRWALEFLSLRFIPVPTMFHIMCMFYRFTRIPMPSCIIILLCIYTW